MVCVETGARFADVLPQLTLLYDGNVQDICIDLPRCSMAVTLSMLCFGDLPCQPPHLHGKESSVGSASLQCSFCGQVLQPRVHLSHRLQGRPGALGCFIVISV